MPGDGFVFKASYLAQSCDQSQYDHYESMIKTYKQQFEKLVGDIDLQLAEGKNVNEKTLKINVTNSIGRMHDYDQDQRRLLKQSYQGAHMLARREFFGQADEKLESWAKAIPQFEPYFSASQICSSWEKIGEYLILDEEKIWHLGEVDRKTKDYRASLSDVTKSEWSWKNCKKLKNWLSNSCRLIRSKPTF